MLKYIQSLPFPTELLYIFRMLQISKNQNNRTQHQNTLPKAYDTVSNYLKKKSPLEFVICYYKETNTLLKDRVQARLKVKLIVCETT